MNLKFTAMEIQNLITIIAGTLAITAIITGAIVFIVRWCFKVERRLSTLELKIDNLPMEIERRILKQFLPYASSIIDLQNNPLSQEDLERMKRLMKKLQNDTITVTESEILRDLLEIEKEEAEKKQNANLILAIGIALAAIAFLAFDKKK